MLVQVATAKGMQHLLRSCSTVSLSPIAPPCVAFFWWPLVKYQILTCMFFLFFLSAAVVAGVSVWMTVPLRETWPPRLLASASATPHTTSASSSMARMQPSALRLMWVLFTWPPSEKKKKTGSLKSLPKKHFGHFMYFFSERLPDSLVFGERLLSLQTGLAHRWHSLWTREGGWCQLLCLVSV